MGSNVGDVVVGGSYRGSVGNDNNILLDIGIVGILG